MKFYQWFQLKKTNKKTASTPNLPPSTFRLNMSNDESIKVKYIQPKIMLIDFDTQVSESLLNRGFNISHANTAKQALELPQNYMEQEIVLADLNIFNLNRNSFGSQHLEKVRWNFDRILRGGGIFILFTGKYFHWGMVSVLGGLKVGDDYGSEVYLVKDVTTGRPIGALLDKHLVDIQYHCTLEAGYDLTYH